MPVYNEAATVQDLLRTVLAQNPVKELIVVDDASSDGSGEILQALAKEKYISAFFFAHTYVVLGDYDRTLDCLEQACEERFHRAVSIMVDSRFAPLLPHPRFKKLLKRMGLAGQSRARR